MAGNLAGGSSKASRCDFEEYQDGCMKNAETYIYVGRKERE